MLDNQNHPNDLLTKVLTRLSVKSLLRLRTVSKHWSDLIKSPSFIDRHLLKQHNSSRVLILKRHLPAPENDDVLSFHDQHLLELEKELHPILSIPFVKDIKSTFNQREYHEDVTLVGPCNGLICIFMGSFFAVCNPTLRQFKKIPPPSFICPEGYALNNAGVGFGVSDNNEYKLLLIGCLDPEKTGSVSVCKVILLYNASTNSWRQIEDDAIVMRYAFYASCRGIFFNGACHWNAQKLRTRGPPNILTFDLSSEAFGLLEYSDAMEVTNGDNPFLKIFNECLSVAGYDHGYGELYIEIWVMKEYDIKESWVKQFVLGPDVIVKSFVCFKNDDHLLIEREKGYLGL